MVFRLPLSRWKVIYFVALFCARSETFATTSCQLGLRKLGKHEVALCLPLSLCSPKLHARDFLTIRIVQVEMERGVLRARDVPLVPPVRLPACPSAPAAHRGASLNIKPHTHCTTNKRKSLPPGDVSQAHERIFSFIARHGHVYHST